MDRKILVNKIRTPDGTILESRHRHDYKEYVDANGKKYMVDGGLSYLRRTMAYDAEELSVYEDDPQEIIREHFQWGTYGKDGTEAYHLVTLKDMTNKHIEAILDTQFHIPEHIRTMFENELEFRKENP